MKRIDSLIALISSLTKAERRAFTIQCRDTGPRHYMGLYRIIADNRMRDADTVRSRYLARYPDGAFDVEVKYLYDKLTDTLMHLRMGVDASQRMLADLGKARLLFERSLYDDAFELVADVMEQARRLGLNEVLLLAQKTEMEFMLMLDFPGLDEKGLFEKHARQKRTLQSISMVTEQASLYNLLRQRIRSMGSVYSAEQSRKLSDLVVSESYSFSAESEKTVELERNHRMFQASYLLETGYIEEALRVYDSIHHLFESNPGNPAASPTYHLAVLEGILRALRITRRYAEMAGFLASLRRLADSAGADFRANILCLLFEYELCPYLDSGDFAACREVVGRYAGLTPDRDTRLSPARECEVLLYSALVELGSGNWRRVRRIIAGALVNHNIKFLPLMRTIRLVRAMAYYELGDHDLLAYETRSIARSQGGVAFGTERLMLRFLSNAGLPPMQSQRRAMWEKLRPTIERLSADRYERQLLSTFDFTAWIEAKLTDRTLSSVLARKFSEKL
ncbi:MAG: hypothetical protein NC406_05690 [Bacteroides sp.]|nr:hypothetical protein [Bacteroides sp.]MCM1096286.1 hypothetical protein [Terasakiella sp.]